MADFKVNLFESLKDRRFSYWNRNWIQF